MVGSNRFRRDDAAEEERLDRAARHHRETITLWVSGASFLALVAATILTQWDQASSSRDMENAIERLDTMASASTNEAASLKVEVKASATTAEAAKSLAATSQKQVDALRKSLVIAERSATAARLLAAIAHDNFLSEKEYRQNSLVATFPLLTGEASVSDKPLQGYADEGAVYFNLVVRNNGATAGLIQRMTFYLQADDFNLGQTVNYHFTQRVDKIVVAGGEWRIPSEQLGLEPRTMEVFKKGETSISVAWIYDLVEYTGKHHLQCQAFSILKRPDRYEIFDENCPMLNEVSLLEELKKSDPNKSRK